METTLNTEIHEKNAKWKEYIDQVFYSQKKNKFTLRKSTAKQRLAKLKKFRALVIEYKDEICKAIFEDFHKPAAEVELTEIFPIISMVNLAEKELAYWMQPKYFKTPIVYLGTKAWVAPEGKGNCLIIAPWNYPFQLSVYPVLTSYMAGNTSILKPSEFTPSTNKIVKKICSEVFTSDEVSIFEGEVEVSTYLLNKPFDHIFFTGSTPVGKIVMASAAKHLASVALELGGKSPVIIDPKADLENAALKLAWGKIVNGGQTCVAPDYLLVHENQKDEVISLLKKNFNRFYNDEKYDQNKDFNHIITQRHADRLRHLISDAVAKGAKIECGNHDFDNQRVVAPTILSNVNKNMEVMQDEIFGPVLPVVTFKNEEEIVDYINEFDNALAMYIFSNRKSFYSKIIDNTTNGGVTINDTLVAVGHPTLPFGGAGKSGIGKYHGHFGFEEFSNMKPILHRNWKGFLTVFYPPYNATKLKLIKTLLEKFWRLF